MSRKLNLYVGVQPNKDKLPHIYAKSIRGYLDYLGAHFDFVLIDFPNYRINKGRVLLKIGNNMTLQASQAITYIIDVDEAANYMRCYFVTRVYDESGFIVFDVELDKWATYIRNAQFGSVHVSRCNRDLGNGIYDTIAKTKGATYALQLKPHDLTLSQCSVVFVLAYNVSQNLYGGDQITKTSLFALSLQRIYDLVHEANNAYDNLDIILKTIDVIGGIHSVGGNIGTAGAQLSAHVLKMWLVPSDTFQSSTLGVSQIVTKCMMTDGKDAAINNVAMVGGVHFIVEKDMRALLDDPVTQWAEFLPDYHIEVGTLYRGMPITRFTKETRVYFHFVYTNIGVNVYVEQGLQQEDITESFEVTITTNNATETSLMTATKSLGKLAGGVAAVAKGYAKGGYAGAAAGAALYGVGLMGTMKDPQPLQAIGTGDGALTFSQNRADKVNNPYYLMLTHSNENEKEHAYYYGVQYDAYNNDFEAMEALPQLGVPHEGMANDGFYIVADEVQVQGMPKEAADFVKEELGRGIWVHVVQ